MSLGNLFGLLGHHGGTTGPLPPGADPLQQEGIDNTFDHSVGLGAVPGSAMHKGIFGIHGTPRDILGVIGDAFLMGQGQHPLYSAQRDKEDTGDALQGYTNDPMAAIQRLSSVNPELAQKYYDAYSQQQTRAAQLRLTGMKDGFERENALRGMSASLLRSATPENYAALKDRLDGLSSQYGIDLKLPAAYDKNFLDQYVNGAVPVDKQIDNEEIHRHNTVTEGIQGDNANTNQYNAQTNRGKLGVSQALLPGEIRVNDAKAGNMDANTTWTTEGLSNNGYRGKPARGNRRGLSGVGGDGSPVGAAIGAMTNIAKAVSGAAGGSSGFVEGHYYHKNGQVAVYRGGRMINPNTGEVIQ